ncbi:MAG: hypothetical protein WC135_02685 [Bacteroidales bacterium]
MKKIILFSAFILALSSLMAQEKEVLIDKDSLIDFDNSNFFLKQDIPKTQYNISMGTSFGRGFFGPNFTSTYIAPSLRTKLNDKVHLRAGVLTGDVWLSGKFIKNTPEDRAPYADRYKHSSAYMGMDFELSPKLNLFVTAFYDTYNPLRTQNFSSQAKSIYTYGFDASLSYEISKNSFLNLSFSYMETNNPSMLMPYHSSPFNSFNTINGGLFPGSRFSNQGPFGW